MIEIDGKVDPNAFAIFDELIRNKKEVIFARVDVKPLQVYENWKGVEQGYGPSGSPVNIGEKHATSIPMEFITLKEMKTGNHEQVLVRYYVNKSTTTLAGGIRQDIYDAGDGNPNFLFQGSSIKLNVATAQGKELFRVLMAHPCNADYPAHGPKKVPIFRLLRPEDHAEEENNREMKINTAIALAFNSDIISDSLAAKLHKSILLDNQGLNWTGTDELVAANEYGRVRNNLASYAKIKPEDFTELVNSANVGIKNLIGEAVNYLVIENDGKKWTWGEKVRKNNRHICDISVGDDPTDVLAAFLVYDKGGKVAHKTITDTLEGIKATEQALKG